MYEVEPGLPGTLVHSDDLEYTKSRSYLRPIDEINAAPAVFYELPKDYSAPKKPQFKIENKNKSVRNYTI